MTVTPAAGVNRPAHRCLSGGPAEEHYQFMASTVEHTAQVSRERRSFLDCRKVSKSVKGRASCHKILPQTIMTSRNKRKSSGGAGNHRVVGSVSGLAAQGRGAAGSGPSGESSECPKSFCVGTLNVGTMRGKAFLWNPEDLSEESPVEGPSEPITLEMITKAISKMASGKAAGPSGIVAEMLKPVGEAGAIIEDIISEACIPTGWLYCQSVQGERGCSEQRQLQGLEVD